MDKWKTNPKEIISPQRVEDSVMEIYQDFNTVVNPIIYEQIKHEMTSGGLSQTAFTVSGESVANKKAREILKLIDKIKEEMEALKKGIVDSSKEQKEIEKKQLIEALNEKIEIEKVYLESIPNSELNYSTGNSKKELEAVAKDRLKKLQERLDRVKAL